jgi:aspartate aminotransferase-like enzyme
MIPATLPSRLARMLGTIEPVLLVAAAPPLAWELAFRLGAPQRAMVLVEGEGGERIALAAEAAGREVVRLCVPEGRVVDPAHLERFLPSPPVDAVAMVCGAPASLPALARVVRAQPDVLLLVRDLAGIGGEPIRFDEWGLDLAVADAACLVGRPGSLSLVALSARFLARARRLPARGLALDLVARHADARAGRLTDSLPPDLLGELETAVERWEVGRARA